MSYTRFALGFSRHKKVNAVSDAAFRLWVSAMDRAREQASDGLLDEADLDLVPRCPPRGARRTVLVRELCASGLWEVRENAWQIHDYLDWQDSAEQIKARLANARQRMRDVRANRKGTDGARANEVRSRSSDQISSDPDLDLRSRSGDPDPDPDAGAREDRETPCPLDLLGRSGVQSMLREMSEKLPAPMAAVEAEAAETVGYYTIGAGKDQRRSNWPRVLRERIRKRFNAGELGGVARGPLRGVTAAEQRTAAQLDRIATLEAQAAAEAARKATA